MHTTVPQITKTKQHTHTTHATGAYTSTCIHTYIAYYGIVITEIYKRCIISQNAMQRYIYVYNMHIYAKLCLCLHPPCSLLQYLYFHMPSISMVVVADPGPVTDIIDEISAALTCSSFCDTIEDGQLSGAATSKPPAPAAPMSIWATAAPMPIWPAAAPCPSGQLQPPCPSGQLQPPCPSGGRSSSAVAQPSDCRTGHH